MKFLITGLPGSTPIPREQGAELLQAGLVWIKSKLADGTIDSHYNIFGGGGLAIVNAGSHEQLLEEILAYPLYPFFTWEVQPLLDFENAHQAYSSFYQQ
ncbi:MAG: hypothetical protein JJE12_06500 [Anaerolineales bacterium]|nr:hypothetical protein [Anaerolineales bacterium]